MIMNVRIGAVEELNQAIGKFLNCFVVFSLDCCRLREASNNIFLVVGELAD